jgi:hypothetical protein
MGSASPSAQPSDEDHNPAKSQVNDKPQPTDAAQPGAIPLTSRYVEQVADELLHQADPAGNECYDKILTDLPVSGAEYQCLMSRWGWISGANRGIPAEHALLH